MGRFIILALLGLASCQAKPRAPETPSAAPAKNAHTLAIQNLPRLKNAQTIARIGKNKIAAVMSRLEGNPEAGMPDYGPVLRTDAKNGLDLRAEFAGFEWTHLIEGTRLLAALDYTVEGLAWEVPVIIGHAGTWERVDFKKPHFSAWIEALMSDEKGGVFLRLGISRGTVADLRVTYSDSKSDADFLDYRLEVGQWIFLAMPQKFLPKHLAISQSKRMAALEKLKLKSSH